jgi:DNA-binding MarR family transcriptional regulator
MDSEKYENADDHPLDGVQADTIRILDRMVAAGWVLRWGRNDRARRGFIEWSPVGRQRMAELRAIIHSVGYTGPATLLALHALCHDRAGIYLD